MASSRQQKTGLTAKGDQRLFAQHNYTDHADEEDQCGEKYGTAHLERYELLHYNTDEKVVKRTKLSPFFPLKLYMILDDIESRGQCDIITWSTHGRSFYVRNTDSFVRKILPVYFKKCKISSFFRQLNLYGFERITVGFDTGAYYNEYFLRGKPFLTKNIDRLKVKGTKIRSASSPQDEPKFYSMPPLPSFSENHQETLKERPVGVPSLEYLETRLGSPNTTARALQQSQSVSMPQMIKKDSNQLQSTIRLYDVPLPTQSTLPTHNDPTCSHNSINVMMNSPSSIGAIHGNPVPDDAIRGKSMSILPNPLSYRNRLPPTRPASFVSNLRPYHHNHLFPATHIPSANDFHAYGEALLHNDPSPSTHPLYSYQDIAHPANTTTFGIRDLAIAHNLQMMRLPETRDTQQIARPARALGMYQSLPPLNITSTIANSTSNLIHRRLPLSYSHQPRYLNDIINAYLGDQASQP